MKALQYEQFRGPIEVAQVADPTPPEGGVVVRVTASGLCRSDWHAWVGHDETVYLPHVPGHEFAGEVVEVGPGVERARIGQRVTAPFVNGCGRCEWCRSGHAQICPTHTQPGFTDWGSHAEYVIVRAADTNLVELPDGLGDDAAASLGCRFATAFHALTERAAVAPGEWVAVVGAGGVGLSAIMIAAALGARPIAIDRSEAALDMARQIGAEATVVAADDAAEQIRDLTGGGAHVSLDAVGSPITSLTSVQSLRRRGRHIQVGLLSESPKFPLEHVLEWELSVLGSHGMAAADYPALLDMVVSGKLRPQDLITGTVDFATAARLIPESASAPSTGMVVLRPS